MTRVDQESQWTKLDAAIAKVHRMKAAHLKQLRMSIMDDDQLLEFSTEQHGAVAANYPDHLLLTPEQQLHIVNCVDNEHANGTMVTNRKLRCEIQQKFEINLTRRTVQRHSQKLGLTWKPNKAKKKMFEACHSDAIQSYSLIDLSKLLKRICEDGDTVEVCTDESCIHQKHQQKHSCCHDQTEFNKKDGKGRCLIVSHAIAENGPLTECIAGEPIDDLKWTATLPIRSSVKMVSTPPNACG